MNSQWSLYANSLEISARDRYERKLKYDDGARILPDLYFMHDGRQNDPSQFYFFLSFNFEIYELNRADGSQRRKAIFYLTTHSGHFICGYMTSDK